MKYVNKQNGKVMEILKQDTERGTLLIQFEDGKTSNITTGTLKRWYKVIEEPAEVKPLIDIDNVMSEEEAEAKGMLTGDAALEQAVIDPDDRYVEEPGTPEANAIAADFDDEAEQPKVRKPRAPRTKKEKPAKEANAEVSNIIDYIETKVKALGAEIFAPEKAPKVRAFKVGGHMFARINLSSKRVCLCCRSKAVKEQADQTQKHIFDAIFVFTDLSNKGLIDSLIQQSFEYQNNKNTQKEEK